MSKLPSIVIIVDSREQKPWIFDPEEKVAGKVQILGTEVDGLDAADYSIKGGESLIRIERKMGFAEIFGNLSNKENKERFERELEKLRPVKHKYILIESILSNDIMQLSIPQFKGYGPPVSRLIRTLQEYELEYDIHVKFCGDMGKRYAKYIFDSIARKYL